MRQIMVVLTETELEHVTNLVYKDILWNQKHGHNDKKEMTRTIYLKLADKIKRGGGK